MNATSQSQINELNKFINSRRDSRELKRAIAVKLALEKYPYLEIQSILNVSASFITKWKKAFFSQGIKGLSLKYKGAKPLLNKWEKPEIIKWLKEKDCWDFLDLYSYVFEKYKIRFKSKQSYYNLFKKSIFKIKSVARNRTAMNCLSWLTRAQLRGFPAQFKSDVCAWRRRGDESRIPRF